MSLNGLDGARVKEAHEAAIAEPGGWFLLKYASRDEVELLGRGNGGIVEIRNNIAQYEDKSPLYGFLRYRRRNVIIKYLPEDCSRLIQARVAVHFNAVCDRFSPYDTDFSITEPKELKDTKLSAACSLHAASGSTSSSTSSLRRRRLMEIAEEEEEEERERKRQSVVNEEERPKSPALPSPEPPVKLDADLAKLPEASQFAKDLHPPHFTGVPRPSSPAKSFDETARRMSSQSSRHDLYPTTSYPYSKPRVKLAPRPSADLGGRPRSSAGGAAHRPVATVPAGIKSMSKGPRKGRSQSQSQDEEAPESPIKEQAEDSFPPADAAEFDAKPSDLEVARSHTSTGSQVAAPATSSLKLGPPAIAPPVSKQNTMTPEKARLLKAMKLREKRMMMSLQPTLDVPAADIPSAPSTRGIPDGTPDLETPSVGLVDEAPGENDGSQEDLLADSKAEDGVDVGTDDASVDTHTDSPPTSPLAASDIGDSTQASSLSESTDETVLAKDRERSPEIREDEVSGSEPTASTIQIAAMPSKASTDETEVESSNRQSAATVTAVCENKEEPPTAAQDTVQQKEPVTSVDVVVAGSLPTPTPSEVSPPTIAPEQEATDVRPAETLAQSGPSLSAPETTAAEAEPTEEAKPSSPRLRIPLSKFSTQETKSSTGAVNQRITSVATRSSDVDSWRAGESAPPVPEKDDSVEKTRATEASGMSRLRLPGSIRTDVDAPDYEKRRSVISILENDGFMDELQSATVQQATPITVSKSPMSPFFSVDQGSKKAGGGLENSPRFVRTVSNPVRNSFLAPGEPSMGAARSASAGAAYLQKISQPQSPADLRPKSAKLGSSISQRIKALEMLSGSAPTADAAPKERPATTFFAVRKAGTREPSRSPSVVDRASSLTRGASPAPSISGESSPETSRLARRDRSGSLVNRLSMFEGGMPPRGRPESVQVTARIVRDPNQPFPKAPEPKAGSADYPPLDLKQSPLVVDVQNRAPSRSPVRPFTSLSARLEAPSQNKPPLLERRLSTLSKDGDKDAGKEGAPQRDDGPRPRRRSSLSIVKDFIKDRTESLIGARSPSTDNLGNSLLPAPASLGSPARPPSVHQNGSLSRRLSISSRRSSTDQNGPALSAAVLSSARTAEAGAESEVETRSSIGSFEKKSGSGSSGPASPIQGKGGRASRFMRRLSNTLVGSSRKNAAPAISPTVAEEDAAEVEAASRGSTAHSQPSIVAFMGDVNVQFPDNLLWKRRSICLDSQGFLILSAVQGTAMMAPSGPGKDRHGIMVKRYHMSDFKPPYAPDVELQELPNSVVLDLVDGSGLQIACEDRAGQMSILHILEEAHQSHTRFGR